MGDRAELVCPSPSRPRLPPPHIKSWPVSVTNAELSEEASAAMTDVAPTAISLSNVGDLAPWSPRIPSCPHVSSPHKRAYACSRERTADTCVPDRCVPDRLDLEPSREPVTEVLSLEATEVPARDEPPRDEAPVVKLFEARDLLAPPALLATSSLAPHPPLLLIARGYLTHIRIRQVHNFRRHCLNLVAARWSLGRAIPQ